MYYAEYYQLDFILNVHSVFRLQNVNFGIINNTTCLSNDTIFSGLSVGGYLMLDVILIAVIVG